MRGYAQHDRLRSLTQAEYDQLPGLTREQLDEALRKGRDDMQMAKAVKPRRGGER